MNLCEADTSQQCPYARRVDRKYFGQTTIRNDLPTYTAQLNERARGRGFASSNPARKTYKQCQQFVRNNGSGKIRRYNLVTFNMLIRLWNQF